MERTGIETQSTVGLEGVGEVTSTEFSSDIEGVIPSNEDASVVKDIQEEKVNVLEGQGIEEVYPISTGYTLEAKEDVDNELFSSSLAREISRKKANNLPIVE
jgi:hypothetical protein